MCETRPSAVQAPHDHALGGPLALVAELSWLRWLQQYRGWVGLGVWLPMRRKIRATAAPPDPSIASRWQGRGRGWRPSQAKPSTIRGRNALTTFDSELGVAPGSFRSIHASVHHVSRRFANRPGADWGPFTLLCATFRLNWLDADHHARTQTSLIKAGRNANENIRSGRT